MAESSYDSIRYRGKSVDDTVDAATAGTQQAGPVGSNTPSANPTRPTAGRGNAPQRGTTNPDNNLDQSVFHKVKTFFGVKD